jgi:ABC-type sugar transport system permease subunit
MTSRSAPWRRTEARLAWALVSPALAVVALVALFPIGWTVWESLHLHDLRMPWLGEPFIGGANYREALADPRFWGALRNTGIFVVISVSLELIAGLVIAVVLEHVTRGRGLARTAVLLPWAVPTVVAALIWRFMFESPGSLADSLLAALRLSPQTWFADSIAAWIPLLLADAWKSTPFVALLLLGGLQNIDPALYEAAAMDGANPWRQLTDVTLPLLAPALLVAFLFRARDAFRVFDVVYVLTGGGPGTATEPIALYAFSATLRNLRFGFGAALSVLLFLISLGLAFATIRLLGRSALQGNER